MAQFTRTKKLTDAGYSPTNPASEAAIRAQIDGAIQETMDVLYATTAGKGASQIGIENNPYATVQLLADAINAAAVGFVPLDDSVTIAKLATDTENLINSKANLTGGNTFDGNQAITNGNITQDNNKGLIGKTVGGASKALITLANDDKVYVGTNSQPIVIEGTTLSISIPQVITTILTGFASGWSGDITILKGLGNLCEVYITLAKNADVTLDTLYTLPVGVRPLVNSSETGAIYTTTGTIVNGDTEVTISTLGVVTVYNGGVSTNARELRRIKFMYYSA